MNTTLLIIITILNLVSLAAYIIIERETRHLIRSHVHILGQENEELVNTLRLKIIRVSHAVVVVILIVVSYALFYYS